MNPTNAKHYLSDAPCKRCGGRVRYKSTDNCIACAKLAVKLRRQAAAPPPDDLFGDLEQLNSTYDPLADLLGDIN